MRVWETGIRRNGVVERREIESAPSTFDKLIVVPVDPNSIALMVREPFLARRGVKKSKRPIPAGREAKLLIPHRYFRRICSAQKQTEEFI